MENIQVLKAIVTILVILTTVCFSYQFIYLFGPLWKKKAYKNPPQLRRYAILIAARNEEGVIHHLLDSIRAQDYPAELITTYVVADNCTDATAHIAREHGARVFRRFNQHQIGKGYALNFLLKQIDAEAGLDSYDAFLVFDADNLLKSDFISQINRVCSDGYQAFCGYRNTKNFGDNWITSGYGLFYLHESTHLNRSRMRLGTNCAINGTGFGFTRELLRQIGSWDFFTLTEDLEFNAWCSSHGVQIGYCHDAIVYDEQPLSFRQSWRQRTRWAQGGMQVSFRYAGALLSGMAQGGWTGYCSFETSTLTFWGYCITTVTGCLTMLLILLMGGTAIFGKALIFSLILGYLSTFNLGLWTMITEHSRIRATKKQKIAALFTFPLFMMTFAPISATAMFRKFQWQPIAHTVAISAESLQYK